MEKSDKGSQLFVRSIVGERSSFIMLLPLKSMLQREDAVCLAENLSSRVRSAICVT
jgi:hypothetical protein